jgi:hypothetical protein
LQPPLADGRSVHLVRSTVSTPFVVSLIGLAARARCTSMQCKTSLPQLPAHCSVRSANSADITVSARQECHNLMDSSCCLTFRTAGTDRHSSIAQLLQLCSPAKLQNDRLHRIQVKATNVQCCRSQIKKIDVDSAVICVNTTQ